MDHLNSGAGWAPVAIHYTSDLYLLCPKNKMFFKLKFDSFGIVTTPLCQSERIMIKKKLNQFWFCFPTSDQNMNMEKKNVWKGNGYQTIVLSLNINGLHVFRNVIWHYTKSISNYNMKSWQSKNESPLFVSFHPHWF